MKRLSVLLALALTACTPFPPTRPLPLAIVPSARVLAKASAGVSVKAVASAVQVAAISAATAAGPDVDPPSIVAAPELARIGWIAVDAGGLDANALAADLATVHGVDGAEVDGRRVLIAPVRSADAAPSFALDPMVGAQWAHAKMNSAAAWNAGLLGEGVLIAVVDTGIDCAHQDLHCAGSGRDFTGSGTTMDGYGHGTHVAGIAAAIGGNGIGGSGVAPRADLLPVRVLDSRGSGADSWIAAGIVYAADAGAKVINLSLGGDAPASILDDALNYAVGRGAFVACAAGNDGTNRASYPNVYAGCVGVAATKKDGETGTSWTNWGVNADVGAPGDSIMSTCVGNDECQYSGTSMASPMIAGVAALAIGAGVRPSDVLALINRTGVPLTARLAGLKRPDLGAMAAALRAPTATPTRVPPTPRPLPPTPTAGGASPATPFPGPSAEPPVHLPWPCEVISVDAAAVTIRCPHVAPTATR